LAGAWIFHVESGGKHHAVWSMGDLLHWEGEDRGWEYPSEPQAKLSAVQSQRVLGGHSAAA